jgi:hypothetical protein
MHDMCLQQPTPPTACAAINAASALAVLRPLTRSGVGKSALARTLASALLPGEPHALLTLSCGELSERHSISRLVGAPPGYVGEQFAFLGPLTFLFCSPSCYDAIVPPRHFIALFSCRVLFISVAGLPPPPPLIPTCLVFCHCY